MNYGMIATGNHYHLRFAARSTTLPVILEQNRITEGDYYFPAGNLKNTPYFSAGGSSPSPTIT